MISRKNKFTLADLRRRIRKLKNPLKAKVVARFFKTGPGEYAWGDRFLGLTVPTCRKLAKEYGNLSFTEIQKLLDSVWHEERLISLLILINKFELGGEKIRENIFTFYLKNSKNVNNWDLVDLSAPSIVGNYLYGKNKSSLKKLARSTSLWERRITMVATIKFIKNKQPAIAFEVAEILIKDHHNLIQKAVGWMLREIEKNSGRKNSFPSSKRIMKNFLERLFDVLLNDFPNPSVKKS